MTAKWNGARINGARSGMAAGLLTGCALMALGVATGLSAAPAQAQGTQTTVFAIPAGPVSSALAAFGTASGVQIVYDTQLARGLRSPGVRGSRTPEQALGALLSGTGLTWRFTSARSVTIEAPREAAASLPIGGPVTGEDMIQLAPITVTGEKLERDLASVYASVGIVTGQQFFDYAIEELGGGLNKLANTRVSGANQGNSGIVIRGVSSDGLTQPSNSSPAVALIVDGASQNGEGIRRGNRGTWDVANVEVLRGPQSTLQGRNAMGGAVIVNTNDPTWHWEMAGEGDFSTSSKSGDFGSGAFMLSGPVAENQLAFRVSGQYMEDTNGISYADPLNEKLGRGVLGQMRAKVLVTPDALEGFEALFTFSHTRDRPSVAAVSGPDYFARRFSANVSAVELRETHVTNLVSNLSQQVGEGMRVRSITAFIKTEADINSPPGSTAFVRDEIRNGEDFTQDLRLEMDEGVRPISGVLGLNFGHFSNRPDSSINISVPAYGLFDVPYQRLKGENVLTSYAAYADMRYALTDKWSVLFGGRLGYESVQNKLSGEVLNLNTFSYDDISQNPKTNYLVALPKIGVAYRITDRQTLAFTASEGFRAGFGAVDFAGTAYEVDPERLWAFEVAYRSKWLDDRLEFNVNGFYYDFDNLQIDVDDPNPFSPQTITANIGKAHAYGAEFELRARLTNELTGFASLGLLKTKFDSAQSAMGNFEGNSFPEAPAATVNVGGVYRHESGFFASADLSYTGSYYSVGNISNRAVEKVDGFTIVNAALGYEARHWSLTLYAKNLFDEQYLTGLSVSNLDSEANIGDGRAFGVRARATF